MSRTSNVYCWITGSVNKTLVPCPNIIKTYNHEMSGVDLVDEKSAAYQLDGKQEQVQVIPRAFALI